MKSKTVFTWRFSETLLWGFCLLCSCRSPRKSDDSKLLGLWWNPLVQYSSTILESQSSAVWSNCGPRVFFFLPADCAHILWYFNSEDLLFWLFPWWVNTLTFYHASILFNILQSKYHLIYLSIILVVLDYEAESHIKLRLLGN